MLLEVSKRQQESLFDSGYQKSPSAPDESPISLLPASVADLKSPTHENNSNKPNKLSNLLSVCDNFDKVNELDAMRKEKKFFSFSSNLPPREVMKKICQEIAKHPVAGPSRDPSKRKSPKKSPSSDSDDSAEEVKSITTCLLENTLNKIECLDENTIQKSDLIQNIQELVEVVLEEPEEVAVERNWVNDNRYLELSNYAPERDDIDDQNDNQDIGLDNTESSHLHIGNHNEIPDLLAELDHQEAQENIESEETEPLVDVEVAWSSQEALFDVNSQVDLLEDFNMDGALVSGIVFPESCIVNVVNSDAAPLEEIPGMYSFLMFFSVLSASWRHFCDRFIC